VEPTPFQRDGFLQLVQIPASLPIPVVPGAGQYAFIAKRTAIAESQASGALLFDLN
jgi:chromosome partitioning protein